MTTVATAPDKPAAVTFFVGLREFMPLRPSRRVGGMEEPEVRQFDLPDFEVEGVDGLVWHEIGRGVSTAKHVLILAVLNLDGGQRAQQLLIAVGGSEDGEEWFPYRDETTHVFAAKGTTRVSFRAARPLADRIALGFSYSTPIGCDVDARGSLLVYPD